MSIWNPEKYLFNYSERRSRLGGILASKSEKEYAQNLSQMEASYDRDAAWFDEFESPEAVFNQYLALGIPANQAAQAAMGVAGNAELSSAPTASGNGDMSQLGEMMQGAAGAFNDIANPVLAGLELGGRKAVNSATARYYNAEADRIEKGNPFVPDQAQAGLDNTNADTAVKRATVPKIESDTAVNVETAENLRAERKNLQEQRKVIMETHRLTAAEADLAEKQAACYADYNDAQIELMRSQAINYLANARKAFSDIHRNETQNQVDLKSVANQTVESQQNIQESKARVSLLGVQERGEAARAQAQEFVNGLEQSLGAPFSADMKDKIIIWARNGDYDKIDDALQASFDFSKEERRGSVSGSIRGSMSNEFGVRDLGTSSSRGRYNRVRVFNPN